ncbi:MAG: LPS assembly protein LptD [Desulfobacterota bacterium]|nr:LPS assembly protein LptD [Thermodesulfobacteriota bacterium]
MYRKKKNKRIRKSWGIAVIAIMIVVLALMQCCYEAAAVTPPLQRPVKELDDLPVNVRAVQIEYDRTGENLIARGAVEIRQGERTLTADYASINLTTKDAHAKGNVELQERGDVLRCAAFDVNLDTQVGKVTSATIFLKQDNLHITGADIKKLGPATYEIQKGTVTTCDGVSPPWRIEAGKIHVTIEGYAWVQNGTFRIKRIPVVYLPVALFPVKTERQTGFLFPEIGHSTSKGVEFNNAFFWAISQNTDATVWLDAATRKGLGSGLEYRFRLGEESWGKLYGYTATEEDDYFDDEYRDRRDRQKQRRYLSGEGEHYFKPDLYVKAKGSYISDREMYGDYRDEINRSKSETKKSHLRSLEKDESLVFLNKNWDTANLVINVDTYKNLIRSDHEVLQRLPQVAFSTMRQPITAFSPFFYQFDATYDYFWRDKGQKAHRLSAYPKISMPINYGGWLKFNPEISLNALSYIALEERRHNDRSGLFPGAQAELSAEFIRIFSLKNKTVSKIRHIVEPGIRYEYIAANGQDDLPNFDIPEGLYSRHSVRLFLKNRFAALIADTSGDVTEHEIGYFLIGQSYNIRHPDGGLYLDGNPDKDYSDVFSELRFGVWPRLYFIGKASYDTYDSRLRYYKMLFNIAARSEDFAQFGYMYERDRFEGFNFRGKVHLTSFLAAFFDARYNENRRDKLDTEIGLDYAAQCWGSRVYIETKGASAGRRSETSFNYRFYLRGLGNKML